jgi:D-glycero-alpha-D-manno-heptose 1-phosphate guanylyltransferase
MATIESYQEETAVIILAGGLGTRLRSITGDLPKPLVRISGRPFIEYVLDHLKELNFKNIFVTACFGEHLVRAAIMEYSSRIDRSITVISEPNPAGTYGAVLLAEPQVPERFNNFLILNGDSLIDTDFRRLYEKYPSSDAVIGGVLVADCSRFGLIATDLGGRITKLSEKTASGPGVINAGIYLVSRNVLREVPIPIPASIETHFFPHIIPNGKVMLANLGESPFIDVGTPASYTEASSFSLIRKYRLVM